MTDLLQVLGIYTPEMYGASASNSPTQNTAAIQRCFDEAPIGSAIFLDRPYTVNGNIKYRGGRRVFGCKGAGLLLAAGVTALAILVPYSWYTTTQEEMQTVTQADKFRPIFDGIYLDGNQANGAVCTEALLMMTSSEAVVEKSVFTNSSSWGLKLTPFNALGHTQNNGNNLFGNMFVHNRFSSNIQGGFYGDDGNSAIITDAWFCHNSVTGGAVAGIHVESGQGWKINGNQFSSVLSAIDIARCNATVVNDNVINAFGNKATLGNRFGINLGGLTVAQATVICVGNSIEGDSHATALAGSSTWIGISFHGRSGGTNKMVTIANNAITLVGFTGTTGKQIGIRQGDASGYNALIGSIVGNNIVSDQNVDGSMSDPAISLLPGHRLQLSANTNGPSLIAA